MAKGWSLRVDYQSRWALSRRRTGQRGVLPSFMNLLRGNPSLVGNSKLELCFEM